ncbi:hypothetical protein AA0313_1813 [Acetobacter indonesiensis NRIC 0313]|nr:hypothetical protein AA0313_1813 [Acetobacter indonesiensis NRIC 0313]
MGHDPATFSKTGIWKVSNKRAKNGACASKQSTTDAPQARKQKGCEHDGHFYRRIGAWRK